MPKLIILLVLFGLIGFGIFFFSQKNTSQSPLSSNNKQSEPTDQTEDAWSETGVAVSGNYADAEVIDLGNGKYRMYYAIEPEVKGNNLEIFSSKSTDGVSWEKESGTRRTLSTFPDVVKLPDNSWRMYFQNSGVIKSAKSTDGLTWTDEAGVRIDNANSGVDATFENVAASTTILQSDGTYIMVYRGAIKKKYKEMVPNQSMGIFLWATSANGLDWKKQGLAIDSRNSQLEGWADGPEWVSWNDKTLKLFFWGYKGVYESTFADSKFSEPKLVYRGAYADKNVMYSPNPPGDPTLMKINGVWNMYYGYHQKGILRAILK